MSVRRNPKASTSSASASSSPSSEDSPELPDVEIVTDMLRSCGIEDYDPHCIPMLLEFAYNSITSLLTEAKVLSEHAGKEEVDMEDAKLAATYLVDKTMTTPLNRDLLVEFSDKKRQCPLPVADFIGVARLPPPMARKIPLQKLQPKFKSSRHAFLGQVHSKLFHHVRYSRSMRGSSPNCVASPVQILRYRRDRMVRIFAGTSSARQEILKLRHRCMAKAQTGIKIKEEPRMDSPKTRTPTPPAKMAKAPQTLGNNQIANRPVRSQVIPPASRSAKSIRKTPLKKTLVAIQPAPVASASGPVVITIPACSKAPTATGPIVLPIRAGSAAVQVAASFAAPVTPIAFARPAGTNGTPVVITIPALPTSSPAATGARQVRFPAPRPRVAQIRPTQQRQTATKRKHTGK